MKKSADNASSFLSVDYAAAAAAFLLTFAVYVYTLAPSVTTEDSGELITAAVHLGVPHPPGYPLWSLSGFLISHLFPFGSVAWRINLMSALFGGIANGLLALMVSHSGRWLQERLGGGGELEKNWWPPCAALTAALILGFSDSMWSQAVIAEVYTLNALFLIGILLCFYRWMRQPRHINWLLATVLLFSLGLTNHHTLLFILPAFLLGVFLAHRALFWSFFTGISAVALSALGILTWYSGDHTLEVVTARLSFAVIVVNLLVAGYFSRRLNFRRIILGSMAGWVLVIGGAGLLQGWFVVESSGGTVLVGLLIIWCALAANSILRLRFIGGMLLLSWAGLLIYGYMHVASSTNPPMNWGFASEKGGFYHAINRGQYDNSLSSEIIGFAGGLVGLSREADLNAGGKLQEYWTNIAHGITLYYRSLEENLTLPLCLLALPILIYLRELNRAQKRWLAFLVVAYFALAFLLIVISPGSETDRQSAWLNKVFYLQSHCAFALGIGYGLIAGLTYLRELSPAFPSWAGLGIVGLSFIPLTINYHDCNQRGHWFGLRYGLDMLKPLEKGAVVFGGTDPGRFVPTYTIFCESTQNPRWKHDPSFDRSDLYIITQNALADRYYMKYIRQHYAARWKPQTYNRIERWLGRDKQYPAESLIIPEDEEIERFFGEYAEKRGQAGGLVEVQGIAGVFFINGLISEAIFQKNKNKHAFYIEESFPMEWMYPYATPSGLLLKINPEPLKKIPDEIIRADLAFWKRYTAELLADPEYQYDFAAQQGFGKLRTSIGNIYQYRQLLDQAEEAYQQAAELCPFSSEVNLHYADILMKKGRRTEAEAFVRQALSRDPQNGAYTGFFKTLHQLDGYQDFEQTLEEEIKNDPGQIKPYLTLLDLKLQMRLTDEAESILQGLVGNKKISTLDFIRAAQVLLQAQEPDRVLKVLEKRLRLQPSDVDLQYEIAAIQGACQRVEPALKYLESAVKAGGEPIRQRARHDNRWDPLRDRPVFQRLVPYEGSPSS